MSAANYNHDEGDSGARLWQFKNKGKDNVELRRRRAEASVELRKAKKDQHLLKRRNVSGGGGGLPDDDLAEPGSRQQHWSVEDISAGVSGQSLDLQLKATKAARKLLSIEKNPPFDDVIAAGLVPGLVGFLALSHCPLIQFEAAWALTNVAAGDSSQTAAVVEAGAVPALVRLVSSPHAAVSEQAVWALGNIAGDCPGFRDRAIRDGAIPPLLSLVEAVAADPSAFPPGFLGNAVWTLSNLCRHKDPPPPPEAVAQLVPALARLLLYHHGDREVLVNTVWALSYLADGSDQRIQMLVQTPGLVPRLVELLATSSSSSSCEDDAQLAVLQPALRAVGNVVTGTDQQTQAVLDAGVLRVLPALLRHRSPKVQKEAAWTLSNVTAGTPAQIQEVVDAGLVPLLVEMLQHGAADFRTQIEAAWAVSNYTSGGSAEQTAYLLRCNVLEPLPRLLSAPDAKLVKVVLDAVANMLSAAERTGQTGALCSMLEECGGLDKMEELQSHQNQDVYQAAFDLIDKYFSTEEDGAEDQAVAPDPSAAGGGGFVFQVADNQRFHL